MFKIESYVTPIILSYVDKYVKDFKPADAQVSLWGGGVALHNLVLKTDVIQEEVSLPFTLVSGRIHELLIQIPWTKIMSEPIVVTIDIIECILNPRPPNASNAPPEPKRPHRTQEVEAPPGYMQALVRRIVNNISIKVHHLILKYVQDDVVLSLNVKNLTIESSGSNWQPAFADIEQDNPVIRRLVTVDDLTLCLDSADADGKIRFYNDPVLYRCRIDLRVMAKLTSANTRRASSFSVQAFSSKIAIGISMDQLFYLLRLLKEQPSQTLGTPQKDTKSTPAINPTEPMAQAAEPVQTGSWSEWAWSWMPSWMESDGGTEEAPVAAQPTPLSISIYLDEVSFYYKTCDMEGSSRKRSESIFDVTALYTAIKVTITHPTQIKANVGIRSIFMKSFGRCPCGHMDFNTLNDKETVYICNKSLGQQEESEAEWKWPEDRHDENPLIAIATGENKSVEKTTSSAGSTAKVAEGSAVIEARRRQSLIATSMSKLPTSRTIGVDIDKLNLKSDKLEANTSTSPNLDKATDDDNEDQLSENNEISDFTLPNKSKIITVVSDPFWESLDPVIFITFYHERLPPEMFTNPYENPPSDFEHSDWEEDSDISVVVKPLEITLCMGLMHRMEAVADVLKNMPKTPIPPMKTLTVEESEALENNLPQRRISMEINGLSIIIQPWDHSLTERPQPPQLVLGVEFPRTNIVAITPLYPRRVCSAAAQLPKIEGSLWDGARLHITASLSNIHSYVAPPERQERKPFLRLDSRLVLHSLLFPEYFAQKPTTIHTSVMFKISELNVSGSAPRLHAVHQIIQSLIKQEVSLPLRSSSLASDAIKDEDLVALDLTMDDFIARIFMTVQYHTFILTVQSLRATLFQSQHEKPPRQAWLFSGSDVPTSSPFLRTGMQYCLIEKLETNLEFFGLFTEHAAIAVDPLLMLWLAYRPSVAGPPKSEFNLYTTRSSKSYLNLKRDSTPTDTMASSSGRGQSNFAPVYEKVHVKPRSSLASSSEPSEKKETKEPVTPVQESEKKTGWTNETLLALHKRLQNLLISVDMGLILVYITTATASAVDCATVSISMENHAMQLHDVLVLSVGRWSLVTNLTSKQMWYFIKKDGPTYKILDDEHAKMDSFPWRMTLADLSCYSLEVPPMADLNIKLDTPTTLRSHIKVKSTVKPRTVIELVTTNLILSVVTKTLQTKVVVKKAEMTKSPTKKNKKEEKSRYFESGGSFQPTSLKDFLRGPESRKKNVGTQGEIPPEPRPGTIKGPVVGLKEGPTVSLGINLHMDTPPVVLRLEQDQIALVSISLHCLMHVIQMLRSKPMDVSRRTSQNTRFSKTTLLKRPDENEDENRDEDDSAEGSHAELQTIYTVVDKRNDEKLKTFCLFQWVLNRINVVVSAGDLKVVFHIDDVITTINLQDTYNQLNVKIAYMSITHYVRVEEEQWVPGLMNGLVLEPREPVNAIGDNHLMSITITEARIADLPTSWKMELHPKLLENKNGPDTMWEIYVVLAPLEVFIPTTITEAFLSFASAMTPATSCPLQIDEDNSTKSVINLPFCYLSTGNIRVLLAHDLPGNTKDDTIVISLGKISLNPHPANPICRSPVNASDSMWHSPGSLEGRQYELVVKQVCITSVQLSQLLNEQATSSEGAAGNNPAKKWGEFVVGAQPKFSTILHPLDLTLLIAPAYFVKDTLACGNAVEFNLTSDCTIELTLNQVNLILSLVNHLRYCISARSDDDDKELCPYTLILAPQLFELSDERKSSSFFIEPEDKTILGDSGVDTATSRSTIKSSMDISFTPIRKNMSVYLDLPPDPADYFELFITMGTIDISLYAVKETNPEFAGLVNKPPSQEPKPVANEKEKESEDRKSGSGLSLTRRTSEGKDLITTTMKLLDDNAKDSENLHLMSMTFHQPNLYFCKQKSQKCLQVSLFNIWMGLGDGFSDKDDGTDLLKTAHGESDPLTEIPPALLTIKYTCGILSKSNTYLGPQGGGKLKIDVERPIKLTLDTRNLITLYRIAGVVKKQLRTKQYETREEVKFVSPLYKLKRKLKKHAISEIILQTTQIGVQISDISSAWDTFSMQLIKVNRPDKILVRSLISSFLLSVELDEENVQPVLHPLHVGCLATATWDAWRRAEGPSLAKDPSIYVTVDLDRVNVDCTPASLTKLSRSLKNLKNIRPLDRSSRQDSTATEASQDSASMKLRSSLHTPSVQEEPSGSDHYYKDDLRSGAFKLVNGGQLPMAYQITIYKTTVSWRYPHPRALTRIVAFPLSNVREPVPCVIEFHNKVQNTWEAYATITVPIDEVVEFSLHSLPPETVFAHTWRFRLQTPNEKGQSFTFATSAYAPKENPWEEDIEPSEITVESDISAEQLLSVLRIDSYFAPRLTPQTWLSMRFTSLDIHAHNSAPNFISEDTKLEGYYISKPLIRSHRVLTITTSNASINGFLGSPAGKVLRFTAHVATQIYDCTTALMQHMSAPCNVQAAVSVPNNNLDLLRGRICTSRVRIWMHIPRIRTLQSLFYDWQLAYWICSEKAKETDIPEIVYSQHDEERLVAYKLEGRISLWIHNTVSVPLRVGQDGTEEALILSSGGRFAYRFINPQAAKRIRFAYTSPTSEVNWSDSTSFCPGYYRVRMACQESQATLGLGFSEYIYAHVKDVGAHRLMRLSGQLLLANMLRFNLFYKVRARNPNRATWRTIASGDLPEETVARSVICATNCDFILKIRFMNHDTGWSGDIPLRECPKENVPWLVKVPSEGEIPYISVWCRVLRARSDGRIFAIIWPLYILHSHLTLDVDVMVVSELESEGELKVRPPPIVHSAPGRGVTTHLVAPGTTSARHQLSFQYRNIETPVTQQTVPLHYGMTDTSVFERYAPVNNIEEVLQQINLWLSRSGRKVVSDWPYSLVAKHYSGTWQPALLQPRCEITGPQQAEGSHDVIPKSDKVRYQPVRTCAGSSLEIHLSPIAILCNAASITLTVRAHDAAPLCKAETGAVISLPSIVLEKPFFLSIEFGRETFVSKQLQVGTQDPGPYNSLPPGVVTADKHTSIAIHCVNKVALFNFHYEIIHDINVLGITSMYVIINKLDRMILVSSVAIPKEDNTESKVLRHKMFNEIKPCSRWGVDTVVPLCRFRLHGRWRGGEVSELDKYVCIALSDRGTLLPSDPVPVRLGRSPFRRPFALIDAQGKSIPVVVTQHKHEEQWVVTVAADPCPQFLVHNLTTTPVAIAQPARDADGNVLQPPMMKPECPGVVWWTRVPAGDMVHYSCHDNSFRCGGGGEGGAPAPPVLAFASLAHVQACGGVLEKLDWCAPVTATEESQLIQLSHLVYIKMYYRRHPHTSLLELKDVGHFDISAMDIRNRLTQSSVIDVSRFQEQHNLLESLERVPASDSIFLRHEFRVRDSQIINLDNDLRRVKMAGRSETTTDSDDRRDSIDEDIHPSIFTINENQNTKVKTKQVQVNTERSAIRIVQYPNDGSANQEEPSSQLDKNTSIDSIQKGNFETPFAVKAGSSKILTFLPVPGDRRGSKDTVLSTLTLAQPDVISLESSKFLGTTEGVWGERADRELLRCKMWGLVIELATSGDERPILAVHVDHLAAQLAKNKKKTKVTLSIANVQVDNLQFDNGQFDFSVIVTTCNENATHSQLPSVWGIFADDEIMAVKAESARLLVNTCQESWVVHQSKYSELTKIEIRAGPLALYIEDGYVKALASLLQMVPKPPIPAREGDYSEAFNMREAQSLISPLRLSLFYIHPLELTLTLHTAVRMYIALDQSPLHLNAFKMVDTFTSTENLVHTLTVHYLSAALLGAGWVVGGLELLGAPGALAARVGGATGGLRGVAQATAAALLRSLAACAGSLARNLDLLAGDEEHARRAAAARRRPPASFLEGVVQGLANFAINMLGAVGGLAHHPLVGVAVGETGSGATALRRSLLGALAKPLSATADLVAYAGHGLLKQTGWDAEPEARRLEAFSVPEEYGWRRDCVRWSFRLLELCPFAGYEVLLDHTHSLLLLARKYLIIMDPATEQVTETIDVRLCSLGPYVGGIIEIIVRLNSNTCIKAEEESPEEANAAAMARVARYTGAEEAAAADPSTRVLVVDTVPGHSHALHAALAAVFHSSSETHFTFM